MEKPQLINFIAKVMEKSGFRVYKNFKTSQNIIDIYAVLYTDFGDFGVVVECNNYDKDFPVSIEIIKHMETVCDSIKASKIVIVSSSFFTEQAVNYALKKNVKLVDRNDLLSLAKRHQNIDEPIEEEVYYYDDDFYDDDYYYDEYDSYEDYDYDYDYDDYVINQRESHPTIYQASLYKQDYYEKNSAFSGLFKRSSSNNNSPSVINQIFSNPIILVLLVVLITYGFSYLGGNVLKVDQGIIGSFQIFFALLLSYGFTYLFGKKDATFLVRGTFIFFISLIILIIIILVG